MTKLSVCITTFKRSKILTSAVRSVLSQSYDFHELIIIDDCSDDDTIEVLANLSKLSSKIKYYTNTSNVGLASSRNKAISMCTGDWVVFLDDDDAWSEGYLHALNSRISTEVDVISCFRNSNQAYDLKMPLLDAILLGITPPVSAQCYRRTTLLEVGGYDEEIKSGVDHGIWIKLVALKKSNAKFFAGDYILPDISNEEGRMTTTWDKRYSGLMNSLDTWESLYSNHFPQKFFKYFRKAYMIYLVKKFMFLYIKRKDILSLFRLFIKFPRIVFQVLILHFRRSLSSPIRSLFIPYRQD